MEESEWDSYHGILRSEYPNYNTNHLTNHSATTSILEAESLERSNNHNHNHYGFNQPVGPTYDAFGYPHHFGFDYHSEMSETPERKMSGRERKPKQKSMLEQREKRTSIDAELVAKEASSKDHVRRGLGDGIYLVDKIIDRRIELDGKPRYLIKWKGYSSYYNTWEPRENISEILIIEFEEERAAGVFHTNNTTTVNKIPSPVHEVIAQKPIKLKLKNSNGWSKNCEEESTPMSDMLIPETGQIEVEPGEGVQIETIEVERVPEVSQVVELVELEETVETVEVLERNEETEISPIEPGQQSVKSDVAEAGSEGGGDQGDILEGFTKISGNENHVQGMTPLVRYDTDSFRMIETETNVAGRTLREILGTTCYAGENIFLVAFKSQTEEDAEDFALVKAPDLNVAFPQQVIQYYQERIKWSEPEPEEKPKPKPRKPAARRRRKKN